MPSKNDMGKTALQWVVTAIFASVILSLLGWLYNTVIDISPIMGSIIGVVLVAILLLVAMKVNPGVESFIHLLPVLLIVSAVIGVIAEIWTASPLSFVIEWSLIGLAIALSAVVFANAITVKVMKSF